MRIKWLWNRITAWRFFFFVCAAVVFHNEAYTYWLSYRGWPTITKTRESVTILLVADAQLVGYAQETTVWGPLTRRDNYHYLWLTFWMAYHYVQPDLVVFLGDLMDEGSTASDEMFEEYVNTFRSIYGHTNNSLYLPGDNDIGGEVNDLITEEKVKRFDKYFGPTPSVTKYKFLNLVKMSNKYSDADRDVMYALSGQLDYSAITVLLNHDTIVPFHRQQYRPLLEELDPSLVICGHTHQSYTIACRDCASDNPGIDLVDMNGGPRTFRISTPHKRRKTLYEFVIPTCSYRMGEEQMAFGVVQISKTGHVVFSSLGLPYRQGLINFYILLVVLFVFVLFYKLLCRSKCWGRSYLNNSNKYSKYDIVLSVRERPYS